MKSAGYADTEDFISPWPLMNESYIFEKTQNHLIYNSLSMPQSQTIILSPLRAKFYRGNINIYIHFVSFLDIDTTQVDDILPQIRQEPTYST